MNSSARIAPKPATEPTATPATAPVLNPELLSLLELVAVSAAAVAPWLPTVTVWTWPPTVLTETSPPVVVESEVDVVSVYTSQHEFNTNQKANCK